MTYIARMPARYPPDHPPRAKPAGRAAGHEAAHLDDDLQRGTGRRGEEQDAEDVIRGVAPDPCPENRRGACDHGEREELEEADATRLGGRGGDREPLGDVVNHEADDQEGAELELAEGKRGPDRKSSPRLWTPIPIATKSASPSPAAPARPRTSRLETRRERNGGERRCCEKPLPGELIFSHY